MPRRYTLLQGRAVVDASADKILATVKTEWLNGSESSHIKFDLMINAYQNDSDGSHPSEGGEVMRMNGLRESRKLTS